MTYHPFPEFELEALALEYESAADRFAEGSKFRAFYSARAGMLRNAVVCHNALRDRIHAMRLTMTEMPPVTGGSVVGPRTEPTPSARSEQVGTP